MKLFRSPNTLKLLKDVV